MSQTPNVREPNTSVPADYSIYSHGHEDRSAPATPRNSSFSDRASMAQNDSVEPIPAKEATRRHRTILAAHAQSSHARESRTRRRKTMQVPNVQQFQVRADSEKGTNGNHSQAPESGTKNETRTVNVGSHGTGIKGFLGHHFRNLHPPKFAIRTQRHWCTGERGSPDFRTHSWCAVNRAGIPGPYARRLENAYSRADPSWLQNHQHFRTR